ncbi:MAG TPA: hypothetical protein VIO14_11375 [Dehalococcoidia bacterium]
MQEQQDLRQEEERTTWRDEFRTALVLAAVAVLMGAAYAAWRAVAAAEATTGARLAEFGEAFVWPGLGIVAVAFTVMWLGWKLELD